MNWYRANITSAHALDHMGPGVVWCRASINGTVQVFKPEGTFALEMTKEWCKANLQIERDLDGKPITSTNPVFARVWLRHINAA